MRRARKTLWLKIVIVALTMPLLQTSCVEITQRTLINGFFDATTPIVDDCFEQYLEEAPQTTTDA